MSQLVAEWIWFVGGVLWFVIRYPHQRKSRKTKVARSAGGSRDQWLLMASLTGLAIIAVVFLTATSGREMASFDCSPLSRAACETKVSEVARRAPA